MGLAQGTGKLKAKAIVKFALVIVTALLASFLMGQATPKARPVEAGSANAAPVPGRYQIFTNPNVRADTFLLDTETGRIWVQVEVTDVEGTPMVWKSQQRLDNDQEFLEWSRRQTLKGK